MERSKDAGRGFAAVEAVKRALLEAQATQLLHIDMPDGLRNELFARVGRCTELAFADVQAILGQLAAEFGDRYDHSNSVAACLKRNLPDIEGLQDAVKAKEAELDAEKAAGWELTEKLARANSDNHELELDNGAIAKELEVKIRENAELARKVAAFEKWHAQHIEPIPNPFK
jgi:hypothetical protein